MALYAPSNTPEQNLTILAANEYPGRLILVGYCGDTAIQGVAITARSEPSQNRRYVVQNEIVSTEVADPSKPYGRPEITVYDAMRPADDMHFVSNGDHTDTAVRYHRSGRSFFDAMDSREYEDDDPIYTSRIAAYTDLSRGGDGTGFGFSILSRAEDEGTRHTFFTEDSEETYDNGIGDIGFSVHTYQGDGNPPLAFDEPPFRIPVVPNASEMAQMLWDNLSKRTRVAVAIKTISEHGIVDIRIHNLHDEPQQ